MSQSRKVCRWVQAVSFLFLNEAWEVAAKSRKGGSGWIILGPKLFLPLKFHQNLSLKKSMSHQLLMRYYHLEHSSLKAKLGAQSTLLLHTITIVVWEVQWALLKLLRSNRVQRDVLNPEVVLQIDAMTGVAPRLFLQWQIACMSVPSKRGSREITLLQRNSINLRKIFYTVPFLSWMIKWERGSMGWMLKKSRKIYNSIRKMSKSMVIIVTHPAILRNATFAQTLY